MWQDSIDENGSIIITLYNVIYISGWLVAVRALNVIGMMLGGGALVFMGLYTFLNSEKYDRMFKTSAMSSAIVAGIYLSTHWIQINLIKIMSHAVSTLLICAVRGSKETLSLMICEWPYVMTFAGHWKWRFQLWKCCDLILYCINPIGKKIIHSYLSLNIRNIGSLSY